MPWEISTLHCSAIKVLSASRDSTLSLRTKFSIAFWTLASTSATLPSQYTFCRATDSSSYARLVCSTSGFTAEGAMSLMMESVPVSTATVLCSCLREIVEKLSTATPVATSEDSSSAACEHTARVSCASLHEGRAMQHNGNNSKRLNIACTASRFDPRFIEGRILSPCRN